MIQNQCFRFKFSLYHQTTCELCALSCCGTEADSSISATSSGRLCFSGFPNHYLTDEIENNR